MHLLEQVNHQPNPEEIKDYADLLGIQEKEYYYIAEKGLTGNLPPNWSAIENKDGLIYYFNEITKKSQWDHPNDSICKEEYEQAKLNGIRQVSEDKHDLMKFLSEDTTSLKRLMRDPDTDESLVNQLPPLPNMIKKKESLSESQKRKIEKSESIKIEKPIEKSSEKSIDKTPKSSVISIDNEVSPKFKSKATKKSQHPLKKELKNSAEKVNSIEDITSKYKIDLPNESEMLRESLEQMIHSLMNSEKESLRKEFEILAYKLELQLDKRIDDKLSQTDMNVSKLSISNDVKKELHENIELIEKRLNTRLNQDIKEYRHAMNQNDHNQTKQIIDDSLQLVTNDLVELQTEMKILKSNSEKSPKNDLQMEIEGLRRQVNALVHYNAVHHKDLEVDIQDERMIKIKSALNDADVSTLPLYIEDDIPDNYNMDIEERIERHGMWLNEFLTKYQ
eukprot:NODE_1130_length_2074_cov_0.745823.p1 type:complete len:448 gc:universal NODE_1130_length_2074_cov_0.745823:1421-78(-)